MVSPDTQTGMRTGRDGSAVARIGVGSTPDRLTIGGDRNTRQTDTVATTSVATDISYEPVRRPNARPKLGGGIGRPVMVVSHFRSGTHLTMDLIRKQFRACHPKMRPFENIHDSYLSLDRLNTGHHRPLNSEEAARILKKAARPTIKTHALPGFEDVAPANRAFVRRLRLASDVLYAVRDGRDVMLSMHAWTANFSEDGQGDFGAYIREKSPRTGLSRAREWALHVNAWLDVPGVRVVRFEDVVKRTDETLTAIGGVLDLEPSRAEPLLPKPITNGRQTKIARALGRLESTNVHNGAYKKLSRAEAFSAADEAFFMAEAGDAMARLGYVSAGEAGRGGLAGNLRLAGA